jgi:hypothetical protein
VTFLRSKIKEKSDGRDVTNSTLKGWAQSSPSADRHGSQKGGDVLKTASPGYIKGLNCQLDIPSPASLKIQTDQVRRYIINQITMKSNTLIQLIALPATLASLLGVDIVAPTVHSGVEVKVRKESADQQPSTMTADQDSNQRYPNEWCLTDNRWTRFCKDKDVVQVLGHINLTMPTIEPRLITMVVRDVQTPTKWTASVSYSSSSTISGVY